MNRWTAEADVRTAPHVKGELDETRASSLVRQQRQADALYGLHNYLVLDSLLKRHLHLDKGFDL